MRGSIALSRTAVRAALEVRQRLSIHRTKPICVFDVADRLGIEVKFRAEKSLNGMFFKLDPPVILVSAHRPPGRQAFTCAHEIGHCQLGHGTRVDKYTENHSHSVEKDEDEQAADVFAANLLMPRPAVNAAFESRGWTPGNCDPIQIYTVATYLGVGYETLLRQLWMTLKILTKEKANALLKFTPKQIRRSILGTDDSAHLVVADREWDAGAVAIDLFTTDKVILPPDIEIEGDNVLIDRTISEGAVAVAQRPGICRVQTKDGRWNAFIRVSRRFDRHCTYIGRSIFRHDEDPDADQPAFID